MQYSRNKVFTGVICGLLASPLVHAANEKPVWFPKISGFATVSAAQSDSKGNYSVNDINNHANFRSDSVVGIQFDSDLGDGFKFSTQLTSRGNDNSNIEAEWLYGSYQLTPDTLIRAGRLRLPAYLASQYHYVGYSYPMVRLPEEVYQQATTTRYNGIEFLHNVTLGDSILTLQPFVGDVKDTIDSLGQRADINSNSLFGLTARLEADDVTLHMAAVKSNLELERADLPAAIKFNAKFYNAGMQYDNGSFLAMAEYGTRRTDSPVFGDTYGYYGTLGYHIDKYTPYVTYAYRETKRSSAEQAQDSKAYGAGLRYDLNNKVALKAEYQHATPLNNTRGMYNEVASKNTKDVNVYSLAASFLF